MKELNNQIESLKELKKIYEEGLRTLDNVSYISPKEQNEIDLDHQAMYNIELERSKLYKKLEELNKKLYIELNKKLTKVSEKLKQTLYGDKVNEKLIKVNEKLKVTLYGDKVNEK